MTQEEIKQAIQEAYLEGLKEGHHQALVEKYDCGIVTPSNQLAELYTQTFFVKQELKSKQTLRK